MFVDKLRYDLMVTYQTFIRELKIFLRYPFWLLVSLVTPFLWVTLFVLFGKAFVATGNIVGFITIGMVGLSLADIGLWGVGLGLRREQMRGTLVSLYTSPASRFCLMLGISLENLVEFSFSSIIIIAYAAIAFGLSTMVKDILAVILTFLFSYLAFLGFGITMGAVTLVIKEPNALINIMQPILLIFSGVFFPIDILPETIRLVSMSLPLTYSINAMRKTLLMGYTLPQVLPDLLALALFAVLLISIGSLLVRKVERRTLIKGSLAKF